jgi:hypothetical protein
MACIRSFAEFGRRWIPRQQEHSVTRHSCKGGGAGTWRLAAIRQRETAYLHREWKVHANDIWEAESYQQACRAHARMTLPPRLRTIRAYSWWAHNRFKTSHCAQILDTWGTNYSLEMNVVLTSWTWEGIGIICRFPTSFFFHTTASHFILSLISATLNCKKGREAK